MDNDFKDQSQLDFTKDWCLYILKFLNQVYAALNPTYFYDLEKVVNESYKRQDLRGLKLVANDIIKFCKLNKNIRTVLNEDLNKNFGMDLETYNNSGDRINTIIQRGEIINSNEYKLLFDYLEQNYDNRERGININIVNKLLSDYQRKTGKI